MFSMNHSVYLLNRLPCRQISGLFDYRVGGTSTLEYGMRTEMRGLKLLANTQIIVMIRGCYHKTVNVEVDFGRLGLAPNI